MGPSEGHRILARTTSVQAFTGLIGLFLGGIGGLAVHLLLSAPSRPESLYLLEQARQLSFRLVHVDAAHGLAFS